jgi:hypothetical protein
MIDPRPMRLSYVEYEANLPNWLRQVHDKARRFAIENHGIVNVEVYPQPPQNDGDDNGSKD